MSRAAETVSILSAPLSRFGILKRWAGKLQACHYGGCPWLALQWEAALMRAEEERATRVETLYDIPGESDDDHG